MSRPLPAIIWGLVLGLSACAGPAPSKAEGGADDAPQDSGGENADGADDSASGPAAWRSALYPTDWAPGFSIGEDALQDFSYAGYAAGEAPLPDLRAAPWADRWVSVLDHGADPSGVSDSAPAVRAAIEAAVLAGGGVVHLPAGLYRLDSPIEISVSSVVLAGDGPETQLWFPTPTGAAFRSQINFRGVLRAGPRHPLNADGAAFDTVLQVEDAGAFVVGDRVRVGQLISPDWVSAHGMDGYWGFSAGQWRPFYQRTVVAADAESGTLTLDVPLRYPLLRRDEASVERVEGYLRDCGVQDLALSDAVGWTEAWAESQAHVLGMTEVEDCWIRGVQSFAGPSGRGPAGEEGDRHLRSGGILIERSRRVTVAESALAAPQHRGEGGNGYLFELRASSEVLFRDNTAEAGRHNFIQNWDFGATGNVWLRNRSTGGEAFTSPTDSRGLPAASETHHALSMANLFDNNQIDDAWKTVNRLSYSSGAGHTATACVYWNNVGEGTITSYQYGRGYVIASNGMEVLTTVIEAYESLGTAPEDWVEEPPPGARVEPASLYEDQLSRRLGG
ncbi:MAG: hypothetical protein JNM72_01690 [Deltaproteobacteria bacterium]|nr:hypothetical protein [Deltaproteobacteria bacterium]